MATRSMIGTYGPDGEWDMRYVHWDGYPEGVGAQLCRIVNRDGVQRAIRNLVSENESGWSSLGADTMHPRPDASDRFVTIVGYGHAYLDDDGVPARNVGPENGMGCEWAYAITEHACGAAMIDVWAWDFMEGDWRLNRCLDCATGKSLTADGIVGQVAV